MKGKTIDVLVEAHGRRYENQVTLDDIKFARIIITRLAFKNYHALINPTSSTISSIFSVTGLTGPFTETTVSGCGEINPLQNDPSHRSIGADTRVSFNDALFVNVKTIQKTPYPGDLSDPEWKIIKLRIPNLRTNRGRKRVHSYREILNTVFYLLRSGCAWWMLPHKFPPWKTVYHYFRLWRLKGFWEYQYCTENPTSFFPGRGLLRGFDC